MGGPRARGGTIFAGVCSMASRTATAFRVGSSPSGFLFFPAAISGLSPPPPDHTILKEMAMGDVAGMAFRPHTKTLRLAQLAKTTPMSSPLPCRGVI